MLSDCRERLPREFRLGASVQNVNKCLARERAEINPGAATQVPLLCGTSPRETVRPPHKADQPKPVRLVRTAETINDSAGSGPAHRDGNRSVVCIHSELLAECARGGRGKGQSDGAAFPGRITHRAVFAKTPKRAVIRSWNSIRWMGQVIMRILNRRPSGSPFLQALVQSYIERKKAPETDHLGLS